MRPRSSGVGAAVGNIGDAAALPADACAPLRNASSLMGWQNGIARTGDRFALPQGVRLGVLPVDALLLRPKEDAELPLRKGPALAPFPWRACIAPLSQR